MNSQAAPGWYPQHDGYERYWDGSSWSEGTRPIADNGRWGAAPAVAPPAGYVNGPVVYGHQPMVVAPKSPGLALVASFFLPGLGQFVNGQGGKGVAFIFAWLFSFVLMFVLIGFLTAFAVWLWSMIDAYSGAREWNARHGIIS